MSTGAQLIVSGEAQHKLVEQLFSIYIEKGFVSTDTVFEMLNGADIPLDTVDRACDELLSLGAIIRDNPVDPSDDNDYEYDRGKVDYEQLYNDALLLEPELESFIAYLRQIQPPQHREWKILLPQAKFGNTYARNRLCEMYLRTVLNIAYNIAKQYDLPLVDTFQDGTIGLLIAIKKYNPLDQNMFPRYFPLWVRQCIFRNIPFSPKPDTYFPVHIKDTLYSIYKIVKNHDCELCDTATYCPNLIQSIISILECSPDLAVQYLDYFIPTESLEQVLEKNPDLISDEGAQCRIRDEQIDSKALCELIQTMLSSLKSKEQEIVSLRYGIKSGNAHTLEEIGAEFGVTRERIRQIEAKVMRKLRAPSNSKKLKEFW